MPSQKEVAGLKQRLLRGLSQLEGALGGLSDTAGALRAAAERGEGELRVAYDRWQESLKEVDQAYATGWTGLSWEIVAVWKEGFLPRLSRLGGERRRLIPRPLKVAVYFILALVVLFVVYLAVSGQLGQVIQFE